MAKYYADREQVDEVDLPVLMEAVARYLTTTDAPDWIAIIAILGIKQEEEES